MTNIVMLVKDRPRLTVQAIDTLQRYTSPSAHELTIMDDGSGDETSRFLEQLRHSYRAMGKGHGIVGKLRNDGTSLIDALGYRGDYLYFTDNDVAFFPGWLDALHRALDNGLAIVGGQRHPYHQPWASSYSAATNMWTHCTDAVAGYSMMMRWETWDRFGPFPEDAKGTGQSEDFALCQRVTQAGLRVGYVDPPVIAHCGITNTEGKPATGAEHFTRFDGLIYE